MPSERNGLFLEPDGIDTSSNCDIGKASLPHNCHGKASGMGPHNFENTPLVSLSVNPGICGFTCHVTARKTNGRVALIEIRESQCQQIQKLAAQLTQMNLKELFLPVTRNPAYIAAEQSGCHSTCAIPLAVLKAVEVALGLALPREVCIRFESVEPLTPGNGK